MERLDDGLPGEFANFFRIGIWLGPDIEESKVHEVLAFERFAFVGEPLFGHELGNVAKRDIPFLAIW